jgi:1-phosphatidylinositol-4-phosphate 5-kinase
LKITDIDHESPGDLNLSIGKEKLGHRRVDEIGNVTYKRVMVDDLIKSLQIGLHHVIGKYHQPQRPVLLQDFQQTDYQDFPR